MMEYLALLEEYYNKTEKELNEEYTILNDKLEEIKEIKDTIKDEYISSLYELKPMLKEATKLRDGYNNLYKNKYLFSLSCLSAIVLTYCLGISTFPIAIAIDLAFLTAYTIKTKDLRKVLKKYQIKDEQSCLI